jgi:hypothetical protein
MWAEFSRRMGWLINRKSAVNMWMVCQQLAISFFPGQLLLSTNLFNHSQKSMIQLTYVMRNLFYPELTKEQVKVYGSSKQTFDY